MSKVKTGKNWKKIILGVFTVIVGLVLIAGAGVFLWVQTWKTLSPFKDKTITIKYPTNSETIQQFGDLGIINKGHFSLGALHTDCTDNTCLRDEIQSYSSRATTKKDIYIDGQKALLYTTDPNTSYMMTTILFVKNDTIYAIDWNDNFIDRQKLPNPTVDYGKKVIDNKLQLLFLKIYNNIIIRLMIASITLH